MEGMYSELLGEEAKALARTRTLDKLLEATAAAGSNA